MKGLCIFFLILPFFSFAQKVTPSAEVITVKKLNIEYEIKDGKLAFLKGCFFTEVVQSKGRVVSTTHSRPEVLMGRKGVVYLENIKKKNFDGSFSTLPPKKLIIE